MNDNSSVPPKDQKEKPNFLVEVGNIEKQLWVLIHSKGLLRLDAHDLYHKACLSYEKIVLSNRELAELQDVEYLLWKLHYKHIDEFRKRIKRNSANSESITSATPQSGANAQRSSDSHIEGFKSFLLEATEFYQNLIVKTRRFYGLAEEFSFYKRVGISTSVEPKKKQKFQFLCHRFFICLGDLARYREQYEKLGVLNHNWSVAATHYLEAIMIWPDSGNPQNQLAVLATYVGDEFLALYHCIRSLAVKEPFPDAWNNLILLFERNRSSHLHSLSSEAHFDFSIPSERSSVEMKSRLSDDFSNCSTMKTEDCSVQTNLWSLIIGTLGFFFIKSSSEDFPCSFATTMGELDGMMALDDTKLKGMLESYQLMDSARTGPFRALQIVSIFIFIFHNLNKIQQVELTRLALTASFIFMGRLVDRCLKANSLDSCPLLPAVLVFVEWLVIVLDEAETYGVDDKSTRAMSYFFDGFVNLLEQLNVKGEIFSPETTALWEDYELRGFAPVALAHASLDFSTHLRHADSFDSGIEYRAQRIICAAMKIANRSRGSRKWITFDKSGKEFYTGESNVIPDRKESGKTESTSSDLKVKVKELHECAFETTKELEKRNFSENASNLSMNGKCVATEEEEVILFKPLTRYNSAPLYPSVNTKDPGSPKYVDDQTLPSDECLCRATSVLIAQNQANGDPSAFHSDISNFRCSKPFKQPESPVRDTVSNSFLDGPISAGPPSLSGWVLNVGSFSCDREKERSDISKHCLSPIPEIASTSLSGLSIGENEDTVISPRSESSTNHYSLSSYSVPVPSAPLLPDNAPWFNGIESKFYGGINKTENFYDASQVSSYPNWTAARSPLDYGSPVPSFIDGYPQFRGMSSSAWLHQYRENHNLQQANNHTLPAHYYAPWSPKNFPGNDSSRFGLLDQYGTPPSPTIYNMESSPSSPFYPGFAPPYGADDHRSEKLFHGYQRPSPYGCGAMIDLRNEPKPLLQYLKEKEWLLQRDPTLRGPTYMGN